MVPTCPRASTNFVLPIVAVLLAFPSPSVAGRSFAIADHDDDDLRTLVADLSPDPAGPHAGEAVVVLARTMLYDLRRFDGSCTENRILLVQGHAGVDLGRLVLPVDPAVLVRARGWVVRADDRVERFEIDFDPDLADPIEFELPALARGDAFGWTATSEFPHGVEHGLVPLADRWTTLRTRVHIKNETHLTYAVEPIHADHDAVTIEVRERRDGRPIWHQIDALDLPPTREAIFTTQPIERDPFLRIVRRGRFYPEFSRWITNNDWDLWAALELGPTSAWIDRSDELRRRALDLTTRELSDDARADVLFDWVVQNLRLRRAPFPDSAFEGADVALNLDPLDLEAAFDYNAGPSSFSGRRLPPELELRNEITGDADIGRTWRPSRARPFETILDEGTASAVERTSVLASLLDAAGLDYLIGLTRDARLGPLDFELAGRWQITDLVVGLLGADRSVARWYCVTRDGLSPGELAADLGDVNVVFVDPEMGSSMEALWQDAWREESGVPDRVIARYVDRIRRTSFTRIIRTPPSPAPPVQRRVEVLRFGRDGRAVEFRVEPADAFAVGATDPSSERRIDVDVTGASWSLDTATLFGPNPLAAWEGPERPPFHLDATREQRWTIEIPKPRSWSGVAGFEPFELDHEALQYRAWWVEGTESIVLERQLVLRRGTVSGVELAELDRVVRAMLDFESQPLELRERHGAP